MIRVVHVLPGLLVIGACVRSPSNAVAPTPERAREAIAASLDAVAHAEFEYFSEHRTFTADVGALRRFPDFQTQPGVRITIDQAGPLGWAALGSHPGFPEGNCVQWYSPSGGIPVPLTRRDGRRGNEGTGPAVCDALEPREPVPLCQAAPRAPRPYADRFEIGPGSSATFERIIHDHVRPYAYSSDSVLDAAIMSLRDSGFAAIDSADATELARSIVTESDAHLRVALAVFRLLDVDPRPLMALVGDYSISPHTRLVVLRSLDRARTDSVLVDAVLVSLCQLSGWLIGSRSQEHLTDWTERRRTGWCTFAPAA